jgi:uncharacterized membrane protein
MPKHHLDEKTRQRMKEAQLRRCRNPALADVIEKNICTLLEIREEFERSKGIQDRAADAITRFSGSMFFVYVHVAWFGLWIALNLGWLGVRPFDPFPFGLLTMVVSLEAIFLSTFVLISQNRMGAVADKRADLDVQIDLLAEHEITRILMLVDAMAKKMGIPDANDSEIEDLARDVKPEEVIQEMEKRARERAGAGVSPT